MFLVEIWYFWEKSAVPGRTWRIFGEKRGISGRKWRIFAR